MVQSGSLPGIPSSEHGRAAGISAWILLCAILMLALLVTLRDLGHPCLTYFDESFHAVVARNLLKHPLTPTLLDHPFLPVDRRNWEETHIWLHKGIVPLWVIAASYKLLGTDVFALRFPSLLLFTASIWLTFEIGRRTLDVRSGLIAAFLQAASPCFGYLVRGKAFSDHVDIALLFWLEAGFLCLVIGMQSGRWRWFILAGVAQGLAFLTKSFVGFLIAATTMSLLILQAIGLIRSDAWRLTWRSLGILLLATVVTAAPWTLWCMARFPVEFWYELGHVGQHLHADVEGWAAPWYRIYLKYCPALYGGFYTPVLTAFVLSWIRLLRQRDAALALPLAWASIVLGVFTLATAKPPMATMIAMPAMYLLLAGIVSRALAGDPTWVAAWVAIVLISLVDPGHPTRSPANAPDLATAARQASWIFRHVSIGLIATSLGAWYARRASVAAPTAGKRAAGLATLFAAALAWPMLQEDWKGGDGDPKEPTYAEIGEFVQTRLPANAVMLVDRAYDGEHRIMQFFTDRTCYPASNDWQIVGEGIRSNGGLPFLFSYRIWNLPVVFNSAHDQRSLYECPPLSITHKLRAKCEAKVDVC